MKRIDHMRDKDTDEKIILKWNFGKQDERE
jgi:hypothetical protein